MDIKKEGGYYIEQRLRDLIQTAAKYFFGGYNSDAISEINKLLRVTFENDNDQRKGLKLISGLIKLSLEPSQVPAFEHFYSDILKQLGYEYLTSEYENHPEIVSMLESLHTRLCALETRSK